MSLSMLQIVQAATGEMGLSVPASVAGNSTQDVVQTLALLNSVGREIVREHEWQALNKQNLITTAYTTITGDTTVGGTSITNASSISGIDTTYMVSGLGINQATYVNSAPSGVTIPLSQPTTSANTGATYTLMKVKYAMPADYDRKIDNTDWDKTKHWLMLGPQTAQQWEWLISGYISTGPRIRYRIFGNYFQTWPGLSSADILGFEYMGNGWATDTSGTSKSSLTVDTDTCIFPDDLMIVALKNKYFKVKGFGPIFQDEYDRSLSIAKANDAGSKTLSMAPRMSQVLIGYGNIPDSGYGS